MPFTIFDSRVDRISINPRKQAFEKVSHLGIKTRQKNEGAESCALVCDR